ncbi:SdrD B-like domain-containing protein [Leucobacter massiliensis]|uniref:SdrD B-like domain-containing protein n=1 Tax=Leucobacter massiliensis TaxID=1686285 RepID=UPI000CFFCBE3|nr:SdrD B-like domain-containing protein [Leucobacter massiliensis]
MLTAGLATPAVAAGETLEVELSQVTGTPDFDADDAPGNDSSPDNSVIRTNDLITYNVEIRAEGGASSNTTFELVLPLGYELEALPAICTGPGSSLVPERLPAPELPLTASSYEGLGQQVLRCNVGERTPGSTLSYPVSAKVRAEVPNGTASDDVTVSVVSDQVPEPARSNPVSSVVSSAAKWDLSKNSTALQPDTGYVAGSSRACSFDPEQICFRRTVSILVGAQNGAKGTSPLTGPITFLDDLSPESLYPEGATASPAWLAAGPDALARYGARLIGCYDSNLYSSPIQGIGQSGWGGTGTEENAVRDSGSVACTQSGPGAPVSVTVTGTDSSLATFPSSVGAPAGATLPANTAYIISQSLEFEIPVAAVRDLGSSDGSTQSFEIVNRFRDFAATALDGTPNVPGADAEWNNFRTINLEVKAPGGFDKYFVCVPGAAGNTPAADFNPGYDFAEGPPGQQRLHSGQITVAPGQTVVSSLLIKGSNAAADRPGSALACDAWDPALLTLAPGDYPGVSSVGQRYPSNGAAVWRSGEYEADPDPGFRIQYSTGPGGSGDASTCASGQWFDDPEEVPGGIDAVSRVRIWVELAAGSQYDINETFFSIALRVSDAATEGTKIPNYAGVLFHFGEQQSLDELLADPGNEWISSSYDPANHSGSLGDRLIAAPAYSRIEKTVKGPRDSDFSHIVPITTGGDTVQYRLAPTLTSSAATPSVTQRVIVEDCLPLGQSFQSAAPAPSLVTTEVPAGAGIECGPRETYLRWDLGERVPNAAIDPIEVSVRVSPTAASGTYTNRVRVSATGDLSTPEQRSDEAQVKIDQPAGVKIDKVPLTPVSEVNRPEESNLDPLRWRIELANVQAPGALSDVDVIDVLPRSGERGSEFTGSLTFSDAAVDSGGDGVRILYTSASDPVQDPQDPSNAPGGSTAWCSEAAGGSVVIGAEASVCPASAEDVTAIRIVRPGDFASGDLVSVVVSLTPVGNAAGDSYVNRAFARVNGLVLPVGPVDAPETIIASAIGDYVWFDANGNGIQDDGELPAAGFPVALSGTDSSGNRVELTTRTDASGRYLFTGLQSGTYTVTFDPAGLRPGQSFTLQHQGDDDGLDSDGDPATGVAGPIELGANTEDLSVDQGIIAAPAEIVVSKTVQGPGPAGPYSFTATCTLNGVDYPLPAADARFTLSHGEQRTISVIAGVTCAVAEEDGRGATVAILDSDDRGSGGASDGVVSEVAGRATVHVTNTFTEPPAPPQPHEPGQPGGRSPEPGLPVTGGQALLGLSGVAVLLSAAGAALVLRRGRRAAE